MENNKSVILENSSLTTILNSINHGVIGVENADNLLIVSEQKPGIFIKHIIIDITHILAEVIDDNLKEVVDEIETEFYDYIVFTVDTVERTLMNMSLLEYILINDDPEFLTKEIWNLYDMTAK